MYITIITIPTFKWWWPSIWLIWSSPQHSTFVSESVRLIIFLFRRHFRILLCKNLSDQRREIVRDQARRSLPLTAVVWWWCHERKCIILPFFSTPKTWTLFNDSTWNMQEFYKIVLLLLIWYLFFNKIIALEDIKYFFYKVAQISSSSYGFYSYLPHCVQP